MRTPHRQILDSLLLVGLSGLLIGVCALQEGRTLGKIGPTLDDAFIHLRFAQNLIRGQGFAFNPGEPLSGSTSPLWVVLLAPFALGDKDFLVAAALVLSALSYLSLAPLTYRLAQTAGASRAAALVAGAIAAANGRLLFAGMSGMETGLFAALSLLGSIVYLGEAEQGRMSFRSGLVFGLAGLARPEGYLLFAGVVLHYLLVTAGRSDRPGLKGLMAGAPWAAVAVFAAMIAPYLIFSLVTTGSPLPTTFTAKNVDFGHYHGRYLKYSALYFLLDNPVAALAFTGAAAAVAARAIKGRAGFLASADGMVAGWAIGYLAVSAVLTPMPFHFCRYQLPVLPFMLILCVRACEWALRKGVRFAPLGVLLTLGALAGNVGFHQGRPLARWPVIIARSAKNIEEMQVRVGIWLAQGSDPQDLVATMDIGAIGFYSERRVLDLVGLVNPEVPDRVRGKGHGQARSEALRQLIAERRPRFLAIFPEMYPGLADDAGVFRPVLEVRLDDNQISAFPWMVLYQCSWPTP